MKSLSLESKVQPRLRSIELVCLITDRPHPTLPGTVLLDKGMPQPCEVKTALLSSREFEMVKRKLPEACVFPGGLSLFSCLCASGLRTCYSLDLKSWSHLQLPGHGGFLFHHSDLSSSFALPRCLLTWPNPAPLHGITLLQTRMPSSSSESALLSHSIVDLFPLAPTVCELPESQDPASFVHCQILSPRHTVCTQ